MTIAPSAALALLSTRIAAGVPLSLTEMDALRDCMKFLVEAAKRAMSIEDAEAAANGQNRRRAGDFPSVRTPDQYPALPPLITTELDGA